MTPKPHEVWKDGKRWNLFPAAIPQGSFLQVNLTAEERAAVERIGAEQRVACTLNEVLYGRGSVGSLLRALAAGVVRVVPPVEEVTGEGSIPPEVQRGAPLEEIGKGGMPQ